MAKTSSNLGLLELGLGELGSSSNSSAVTATTNLESISFLNASLAIQGAFASKPQSISTINAALSITRGLSSNLQSASNISVTALGNIRNLASTLQSISFISSSPKNTVNLVSNLQSQSDTSAGIVKFLGAVNIASIITPVIVTAYLKGVPRPIAYLSNDNDRIGRTSELITSSPSDYDFK